MATLDDLLLIEPPRKRTLDDLLVMPAPIGVADLLKPTAKETSFLAELNKGLSRGTLTAGAGLTGTAARGIETFALPPYMGGAVFPEEPKPFEPLRSIQRGIYESRARPELQYTPGSKLGYIGSVLGETIPYMGAALIAGVTTGPIGAALVGFSVEGEEAYQSAIKKGASKDDALLEGTVVGAINAAIEALQISRIIKFSKGTGKHSLKGFIQTVRKKALKDIAKEGAALTGQTIKLAIEEGIEEFAQEGVSMAVPAIVRDDYPTKPDGTPDWWAIGDRLGRAFMGGFTAGGVLGGIGSITTLEAEIMPEAAKWAQRQEEIKVVQEGREAAPPKVQAVAEGKVKEIKLFRSGEKVDLSTIDDRGLPLTTDKKVAKEFLENKRAGRRNLRIGGIITPDVQLEEFVLSPDAKIATKEDIPEDLFNAYKETKPLLNPEKGEAMLGRWAKENGFDAIDYRTLGKMSAKEAEIKVLNPNVLQPVPTPLERKLVETEPVTKLTSLIETQLPKLLEQQKELTHEQRQEQYRKFEEAMAEAPPGKARYFAGLRALKVGEFERVPLDPEKILAPSDISELYEKIFTSEQLRGFQKLHAWEGLTKLFDNKLPQRHQVSAMRKVFGAKFARAIEKAQRRKPKLLTKIMDVFSVPISTLASGDISATLRQGYLLATLNPKGFFKALRPQMKALLNETNAQYLNEIIRDGTLFGDEATNAMHEYGLDLTTWEAGAEIIEREERFSSYLARNIPGIRPSERAFNVFLNTMRASTFAKFYHQLVAENRTEADFRELARAVNVISGRGDLKALKSIVPFLNTVMFAPRYRISRLQIPYYALKHIKGAATGKSIMGKLVWRSLISMIALNGSILGMIKLFYGGDDEVDVELDPRSTDWGKLRIGDIRVDPWAGFQPAARTIVQTALNQRKTGRTKRIVPANRARTLWRYFRSGMSPAAGLVSDLLEDRTFMGEEMVFEPGFISKEAIRRFLPMAMQDIGEASWYYGLSGTSIAAPTAILGLGVQVYEPTAYGKLQKTKDYYSRQSFGKNWGELNLKEQWAIYNNFREPLEALQRKAKFDRRTFPRMDASLEEQEKAARRVTKLLPQPLQKELIRLELKIPGFSRSFSFLQTRLWINDQDYKTYQQETAKTLTKVLGRLFKSPGYRRLSNDRKRDLSLDVINTTKQMIRSQLITGKKE